MRKELWRSSDNLLSWFRMDPLRDLEKVLSTQTMVEDVENKRNLNMKSIEAISEINIEVIEEILIQPIILISLTQDSMRRVEQRLKMEIITPICNSETDLERTWLHQVDNILNDFKTWKAFIDAKSQPPRLT
jgi:hypothetical protein